MAAWGMVSNADLTSTKQKYSGCEGLARPTLKVLSFL